MQPVGERHQLGEHIAAALEQLHREREVAAVGDQIPQPRGAFDPLHVGKRNGPVLQDLVRRRVRVHHVPRLVVARDRRTAQALENAQLDLVRPGRPQPVEAAPKAGQILAGQPGDQIGVDVHARVLAQIADVGVHRGVVLAPTNALSGGLVEGLHADFELQRPGRKLRHQLLEPVGKPVGHHFEVGEHIAGALQEELEDARRRRVAEVERSVDEAKLAGTAVVQQGQVGQQPVDIELAHLDRQRRQTKLAGERAASRRLDVDRAVRDVLVGVQRVGRHQPFGIRQLRGLHLDQRPLVVQKARGQLGERQLALPRHHEVGAGNDLGGVVLVAHLRATDDDVHVGAHRRQHLDHREGLGHVPHVNTERHDAWVVGEQGLDHLDGPAAADQLADDRARRQRPQVGLQIAQRQRAVAVARVDGGKDDVGHCPSLAHSHGRLGSRDRHH